MKIKLETLNSILSRVGLVIVLEKDKGGKKEFHTIHLMIKSNHSSLSKPKRKYTRRKLKAVTPKVKRVPRAKEEPKEAGAV